MTKIGSLLFSVLVAGLLLLSAAAPDRGCNVRSSGCAEAAAASSRMLQSSTLWKYNMLSCYNGNDFVWVYEWGPFDITVETSSPLNSNNLEMTLKAVDTMKVVLTKQPSGVFTTTQVVPIATGPQDNIKIVAQNRLADIIRNADRVEISSDGKKLTFYRGQWRIAFDRFPLTEPIVGQEWTAPIPLEQRELQIVPQTYFVNGHFEQLYTNQQVFPMTVYMTPTSDSSVSVILRGLGIAVYEIHYQPADGWVTRIQQVAETILTGNPDQMASERKIREIIGNVQQIAFENRKLVQFITNNGNTRISFSSDQPRALQAFDVDFFEELSKSPLNYFVKQEYVGGSTGGGLETVVTATPMAVSLHRVSAGRLLATVSAVNTRPVEVMYSESDGLITQVIARPSTNIQGEPETLAAEIRTVDAIRNAQRISPSKNGEIVFLGRDGTPVLVLGTVTTSRPSGASPIVLDLMPETYKVNGNFEKLFPGASVPVTVELLEYYSGLADITLHVVNIIKWRVAWNSADGWVSQITPGGSTLMSGPPDLMEVERRLSDIIGHVQQIAFERDGMVQFIKDYAATRVAFMKRTARRLQALEEGHLILNPDTYMVNGKIEPLFGSTVFPVLLQTQRINPGHLSVTVNAGSDTVHEIIYDEGTGLVTEVKSRPSTQVSGLDEIVTVERRIQDVFSNLKTIVYTDNGIKFNTINGGIASQILTIGQYVIKPETYFRNGKFEPLFRGPSFPISVTLAQDEYGNAKAVLHAIKDITYFIKFQRRDGWVLQRMEGCETLTPVTPDQQDTINKLKEIFVNVQQLAFENDGTLQFITNNAQTRVSFIGKHDWWTSPIPRLFGLGIQESSTPSFSGWIPNVDRPIYPGLTPEIEQPIYPGPSGSVVGRKNIIAGSYRKNGRADPLFVGPQFPVYVDIRQPYNGYVEVTLHAVNTIVYGMNYQIRDGWVTNRFVLSQTLMEGSWDQKQTEENLKYILGNVQQIAFEKSGQIQFITDNSSTRISFM